MFLHKCALRRMTLPILPCDCNLCDWYILNPVYSKCFWVLAQFFEVSPGSKLSFEEISELEGISVDEAVKIYETAIGKLRLESRGMDKNDNLNNVS